MGFRNRNSLIFFFIILNVCRFELMAQEKESVDLDYLYSDWAYSYNESYEDIVILRKSTDDNFLSMEERKDWFGFKKGHDSILHNERINSGKQFFCGQGNSGTSELNRSAGLHDLWTYNSARSTLTHTLCGDLGEGKHHPLFTSMYKILEIEEDYVKLQLLKELFEGVE